MSARTYGANHPLVSSGKGDPARGEWAPRPKPKGKSKGGPRRGS